IIYNKSSNDPMQTEINLEDLSLFNGDGFEMNIYNKQRFRVPRHTPVQFSTCRALLNHLGLAKNSFLRILYLMNR
ncbi:hypothetical protein CY34DRAFT_88113, partial [Suillus luteus UH-Slu-Lm8-n1]